MSGRLQLEGTGSRNPNVPSQVQHPKMEIPEISYPTLIQPSP